MHKPREWTDEMDETLLRLRAKGRSSTQIGAVLGINATSVSGRIWLLETRARRVERDQHGAWPLPAFHPITWGAINPPSAFIAD